jgi:hypothetical protein
VWCGVVWCGVVWCGVVWCGVVWCGVVWCGGCELLLFTAVRVMLVVQGRLTFFDLPGPPILDDGHAGQDPPAVA